MFTTTALRAPIMRTGLRAAQSPLRSQPMFKRFAQQDNRGGKSKLMFRIGLKDIPVELYPMGFVVGAGIIGASIAIFRHFWNDGLRTGPGSTGPRYD